MINNDVSVLYDSEIESLNVIIETDDGIVIDNNNIYSESFELKESLCSESELRLGSCESSELKIKVRNEFGSLKGKKITVSHVLNGLTDTPFRIGKYTIESCELSGDKKYVSFTAYDEMYRIINADVVDWYDSIFQVKDSTAQTIDDTDEDSAEDTPTIEYEPVTLKELRDSFFEYLGVEQEETELRLDSLEIEKTINSYSLSGLKVISAICELNGVFGHINREGIFTYVSLKKSSEDGTIASEKDYTTYQSCEYDEFITQTIDSVQIRQEDDDIGATYGDGSNAYVVQDNFLVYGKTESELEIIGYNIWDSISGVVYRPFTATMQGKPYMEVGDRIKISTTTMDVESYILERTFKGILSLKDTFETQGTETYSQKANSVQNEIRQLKGKSNVLTRTVEETVSRVTDVEVGYTQIQQTSENLKIDVSNAQSDLDKMSYSFTSENLVIEKEGAETKTEISENGMRVLSDSGDEMLVANKQGVDAKNLHANTYLIIGSNSRLEDYNEGTGCFWIGA